MTASRWSPGAVPGAPTLWAERPRNRIVDRQRVFSLAMCRALRSDWDLDAAAHRIVALGIGDGDIERALDAAHRVNGEEPTLASVRAERSLARALELTRSTSAPVLANRK